MNTINIQSIKERFNNLQHALDKHHIGDGLSMAVCAMGVLAFILGSAWLAMTVLLAMLPLIIVVGVVWVLWKLAIAMDTEDGTVEYGRKFGE